MAKSRIRNLTLRDLEAEIDRRRRQAEKLYAERERLLSRLAEVDQELADLIGENTPAAPTVRGGRKKRSKKKGAKKASANGRRRRPGGQPTLPDMLADIMSPDEPSQVGDLAIEVQRRGYKTTSSNLPGLVSQALAKDPRFKKVKRGQFVLAR